MRVGVGGASGFIGKHLCAALRARGDEVVETSLRDPADAAAKASGCEAFVNLAGETLGQRWNDRVKAEILSSRTQPPRRFFDALEKLEPRPRVYISASAVGYYGASETATFTESDPPGNDFLARVCVEWERTAQAGKELGMRVACVRSGLVLSRDGGALQRLLPIFKSGGGGRVGSGRQWYSWIHIADAVGIYMLAIDGIEGAINATAPNPVRNAEFSDTLARALGRPSALPAPAFAIKLMLGEGATIVLDGQRVLPARAQSEGYAFRFADLSAALANLLA
ncbi:MAG TPA: TIGR01777 family oxidoreductase [Candidatus Baltobacteraceae bacterium]|nr:TIGR01777 family oxidoreductase [Candidatus Baltobacteraceae bacterium]